MLKIAVLLNHPWVIFFSNMMDQEILVKFSAIIPLVTIHVFHINKHMQNNVLSGDLVKEKNYRVVLWNLFLYLVDLSFVSIDNLYKSIHL